VITTYCSNIGHVSADEWDRCVPPEQPLLRHANFHALEHSGIACPSAGFTPSHVVLRDEAGRIAAIAPAYIKQHSKGELGVDLGLAMAYQRMCGSYYPKLQVEIPMTPFAGARLLVRPDVPRQGAVRALISALQQRAQEIGASSVHITFMADGFRPPELDESDFTATESNTYMWQAHTDRCFEEFLGRMASANRYEIRRERKLAQAEGFGFRRFTGPEITAEFAERFFPLYAENFTRHQGVPWFNEEYFRQLFSSLSEFLALDVALIDDEWVAAALTPHGGSTGQVLYWGQSGRAKYLHFEMVIYRSIEYALATGITRLDIGAMGAHKAPRGLICTSVNHGLWFRDPAFKPIVQAASDRRKVAACTERERELGRLPFRRLPQKSLA
jgi:predicted N-acyltransferase